MSETGPTQTMNESRQVDGDCIRSVNMSTSRIFYSVSGAWNVENYHESYDDLSDKRKCKNPPDFKLYSTVWAVARILRHHVCNLCHAIRRPCVWHILIVSPTLEI